MVFSSLTFLFIFLPITIFLYFIIKNRKWRNTVLCLFSLIFYAWGEPKYILLMLFSIIFNYYGALLINKVKKKKLFLGSIIFVNILLLVIFKYTNFFLNNINNIFNSNIKNPNIILPIGISFYTFQILSYVIDVYKGKVEVQKNIIKLATYISLFPQLIAGPIVRYETICSEIDNRKESLNLFTSGVRRFVIGLAKKVIIANKMAIIADLIFANVHSYGTMVLWLGAIAYTMQIYFDFSGYSDMAIGLGKMFGFNFLENFNYPYISTSITDFWHRWHISLSSFFKDYVYIPLGGSKCSKIKNIRNIFIVWLLTGLWHGASWNFVIWGLYYALLLILEKFILKNVLNKFPKFIKHIYTLFFIVIGWVIFRVENLKDLLFTFKRMFIFKSPNFLEFILNNTDILYSIIFIFIAVFASIPIYKKLLNKINNSKLLIVLNDGCLYLVYLACIINLVASTYNPFIYFRF